MAPWPWLKMVVAAVLIVATGSVICANTRHRETAARSPSPVNSRSVDDARLVGYWMPDGSGSLAVVVS
jgi:hypothetical protein